MPITFTGVPPGGWFGEGTVLKREVYRYNIQALRRSVVTGISVATFHWLLDRSIGFNRFVMMQLNERLGQFIAAREIDRLGSADERVARSLARCSTLLYPGVGSCCASRSRSWATWWACRASASTRPCVRCRRPVIRIEYGGLRVLDLEALRALSAPGRPQALIPEPHGGEGTPVGG
jgi:CRP/FNR family cyclic AMP-dependent transcriptional regulator